MASDEGGAVLEVSDVHLTFGGVVALDGVSFQVSRGEVCGLIGPNGAGKTTLFNCISRLYHPDSGSIRVNGNDILGLRPDQIAKVGVARTFQNVGLFPGLSVLENVMTGSHHQTRGGFAASALALRFAKKDEDRARERALIMLDQFGLRDLSSAPAEGLPFGTLKRIELARAVMSQPQLLMLDEPANGLVHEEVMELAGLVSQVAEEERLSVLVVEHHMAMVMSMSHQIVVLNFGRKIASGPPAEVRRDPAVVEAYLGGAA